MADILFINWGHLKSSILFVWSCFLSFFSVLPDVFMRLNSLAAFWLAWISSTLPVFISSFSFITLSYFSSPQTKALHNRAFTTYRVCVYEKFGQGQTDNVLIFPLHTRQTSQWTFYSLAFLKCNIPFLKSYYCLKRRTFIVCVAAGFLLQLRHHLFSTWSRGRFTVFLLVDGPVLLLWAFYIDLLPRYSLPLSYVNSNFKVIISKIIWFVTLCYTSHGHRWLYYGYFQMPEFPNIFATT